MFYAEVAFGKNVRFNHEKKIAVLNGSRTMTTESGENGAITLPRMNISDYGGRASMFSWTLTIKIK